MSGKETRRDADIITSIEPGEAWEILRRLAKDPALRNRIEDLAQERLADVDVEGVAGWVYDELDTIDVHDLWESAGSTRYGYVHVSDRAWDMFDEALEPVREEMERYRKLSMRREETIMVMGMLKGLYDYETGSTSEFKDWAVDAPHNYYQIVVEKWRETCTDPEERREVEEFLKREVPGWCGE